MTVYSQDEDLLRRCIREELTGELALKSEINLGVKDLTVNAGEILYIASNETVAVNRLTNNNLIIIDGKLIAREINNSGTVENNNLIRVDGKLIARDINNNGTIENNGIIENW